MGKKWWCGVESKWEEVGGGGDVQLLVDETEVPTEVTRYVLLKAQCVLAWDLVCPKYRGK